MSSSFKDFKKNKEKIKEAVHKLTADKPKYNDDRVWNLQKDAAGNGLATIRFLPQKDVSKAPIVQVFRHSFQKNGRWFIEECPHTIGEKCPVCEYSGELWDTDEQQAREYWRKKTYIANVLIVKDEANPANNGQVKLFKFGKQIYDQIMDTYADMIESDVNIFDFDEGLDFRLKLGQKAGYNNYDKSKFVSTTSAIADGDEKIQAEVFEQINDLDEFLKRERFKGYDEIRTKFKGVVSSALSDIPTLPKATVTEKEVTTKPAAAATKTTTEAAPWEDGDDIDFDALLEDND